VVGAASTIGAADAGDDGAAAAGVAAGLGRFAAGGAVTAGFGATLPASTSCVADGGSLRLVL